MPTLLSTVLFIYLFYRVNNLGSQGGILRRWGGEAEEEGGTAFVGIPAGWDVSPGKTSL